MTNLYKVYYRERGHLTNAFVTAMNPDEAADRFNRLFPNKNLVKVILVPTAEVTIH